MMTFVLYVVCFCAVVYAGEDYSYDEVSGGIELTGYSGDSVDVIIPESIDGKSVVALSESMLCKSIWQKKFYSSL